MPNKTNNLSVVHFSSQPDTAGKDKFDTAEYAREIFRNKQKYVNQQLSVLLSDLKLPVKSYWRGVSMKISELRSITLLFDDKKTVSAKMSNSDFRRYPVTLTIVWKTVLSSAKYAEIINQSTNRGEWQAAEQQYYSKQIVGDIGINRF